MSPIYEIGERVFWHPTTEETLEARVVTLEPFQIRLESNLKLLEVSIGTVSKHTVGECIVGSTVARRRCLSSKRF